MTQNSNTQLFRGSKFPVKDMVSKFTKCVMIQISHMTWGVLRSGRKERHWYGS